MIYQNPLGFTEKSGFNDFMNFVHIDSLRIWRCSAMKYLIFCIMYHLCIYVYKILVSLENRKIFIAGNFCPGKHWFQFDGVSLIVLLRLHIHTLLLIYIFFTKQIEVYKGFLNLVVSLSASTLRMSVNAENIQMIIVT